MVGARANWHTDVPNFARLQYSQVYPGIDLIYYGSNNRLEYDFVVAPGADPAAIRMRFQGAGALRVTQEGDFAYEGPDGVMIQRRPVIYQEDRWPPRNRRPLRSRFARYGCVAREGIRPPRKLVIDPILSYSTYLGGSQDNQITSVQLSLEGPALYGGLYAEPRTSPPLTAPTITTPPG